MPNRRHQVCVHIRSQLVNNRLTTRERATTEDRASSQNDESGGCLRFPCADRYALPQVSLC